MSSLQRKSVASSQPTWFDPERKAGWSYDLAIIAFAGLVVVGLIVAIYGLTVSPGIDPNEFALMSAYS